MKTCGSALLESRFTLLLAAATALAIVGCGGGGSTTSGTGGRSGGGGTPDGSGGQPGSGGRSAQGGNGGQPGTGGGVDAAAGNDAGATGGTTTADGSREAGGDAAAGTSGDGARDMAPDAPAVPDAGRDAGMVAGDALDGNGTPANQIDVYLIGGQSNATGQGYVANLPATFVPDTRVLLFHSGLPHLDSGATPNTWIPLRQASESPDRFGPELGFGNQIQGLYPNRKIAIIKHAHTGTSLFADWVPGTNAADTARFGPQFQVFVATVDAGLKGLRDMGFSPVLRAMLWQQGENDADAGGTFATQYGANLAAFIRRVREQWSAPSMLFIYGYVYPPPNVGAGRDLVRAGERDVDQDSGAALAVPGAFVVLTDDLEQRAADRNTPLPNDHVHFGTAGQLDLGSRMAAKAHDHLPAPP